MKIAKDVLGHPAILFGAIIAVVIAWSRADGAEGDETKVYRPLHPASCHGCQASVLAGR